MIKTYELRTTDGQHVYQVHEGPPSLHLTKTHVRVFCPRGHYVLGVRRDEWSESKYATLIGRRGWRYKCTGEEWLRHYDSPNYWRAVDEMEE